jgi:hypothetical protein
VRIDPRYSRKFQFSASQRDIEKKKKWYWEIRGARAIPDR